MPDGETALLKWPLNEPSQVFPNFGNVHLPKINDNGETFYSDLDSGLLKVVREGASTPFQDLKATADQTPLVSINNEKVVLVSSATESYLIGPNGKQTPLPKMSFVDVLKDQTVVGDDVKRGKSVVWNSLRKRIEELPLPIGGTSSHVVAATERGFVLGQIKTPLGKRPIIWKPTSFHTIKRAN